MEGLYSDLKLKLTYSPHSNPTMAYPIVTMFAVDLLKIKIFLTFPVSFTISELTTSI